MWGPAIAPQSAAHYLQTQMRSEVHREIALLMTQMRRLCTIAINKQLALVGRSSATYQVLFRLVHDEEVPQNELAFDAAIDPAALSRLIREMVAEGLVTTRVDPTDKRQRVVKATRKGRALESTLRRIVDETLAPFMGGLTEDEEQEFLRLLRKAYGFVIAVSTERNEAQRSASEGSQRPARGAKDKGASPVRGVLPAVARKLRVKAGALAGNGRAGGASG